MCTHATENNKNYEDMKLDKFVDITNDVLKDMSLQDFVLLAESFEDGEFLYRSKQNLFNQQNSINYDINENQVIRQNVDSLHKTSHMPHKNSEPYPPESSPKRKPGRPRSTDKFRKKPEKRLGKLWEFLRNLLLDAKTCPSLIKWDNYNEGTFKFVESEKVAKLWGDRKKNDKMNYEKLSRAMRYYYKSEVLLPVPGKRLVYKFGPQASGWRTANPLLENKTCNLPV
ncbi:hypothetical protein ILUMI_05726 [Ignelater luminosus]|uniref:ETS domain-containing protein n=1 Tax=Ignelater luminosus TaxID=2038154 RepID=A0A8K0DAJ9_IGNLU|nr:hypothetical protein ILUMI_05726 [Ignelater luminosus]